mmetsp:Transcript_2243/g.6543  ORF Transcript_2243/g.6543 Transcript_2243/m.6543 type:complete len:358 (-) Transcript_2243:58-1131(-)
MQLPSFAGCGCGCGSKHSRVDQPTSVELPLAAYPCLAGNESHCPTLSATFPDEGSHKREEVVVPKKSIRFVSKSRAQDPSFSPDWDWDSADKSQIYYTAEETAAMKSTARRTSLHFRSRDDHRRANRQSIEDEFEEPLPPVLSVLDSTATEKEVLIMKALLARQLRRDKKEMDESPTSFADYDTCDNVGAAASTNKSCIPRGLEQRVSFRRQWKKFQTVRCVLECQRVLRKEEQEKSETAGVARAGQKRSFAPASADLSEDCNKTTSNTHNNNKEEDMPTKLARASSRCSQWARGVALATGQTDMLEVYPEMASVIFSRQAQNKPTSTSPPPQVVPGRNAVNTKLVFGNCYQSRKLP